MLIGKNIRIIRQKWKLNQTEFGLLVDATRGMIMQYETRGSKPKDSIVSNVSKVSGFTSEILFNYEIKNSEVEPMSLSDSLLIEDYRNDPDNFVLPSDNDLSLKIQGEAKQVPFEDFMDVPYLPVIAQAGYLGGYADNQDKDSELYSLLVPREFEKGRYLVVEVNGDSMDDDSKRSICDGDKLLAKEVDIEFLLKNERFYKTNLFVLMTRVDGVVVKQITNIDKKAKSLLLHSWNSANEDFSVEFVEIIRIMVVKKIVERRIRL